MLDGRTPSSRGQTSESRMRLAFALAILASLAPAVRGEEPDPKSVRWYDKGYRYEQGGWVVLHVEGEPYPRGYQHGRLMAAEIESYAETLAAERYPKDPE